MKKNALCFIAISFVVLYCGNALASEKIPFEIENLYNQAVTSLWIKSDIDNNQPICSVFYWKPQIIADKIERSYILTAGHCHGEYLRLDYAWWTTFSTHLVVKTNKMDYCLISVNDFRTNPVYFKVSRLLKAGEAAYTTKSVLEYGKRIELQRLAYIGQNDEIGTAVFRGESPLEKGMSGSPVVSEAGELLGILVMGDINDRSIYYVLPLVEFIKVFETVKW